MWNAPAQMVISHLRRDAILRRIDNRNFPDLNDVGYVNGDLPMVLADAHVFDLGQLLDEQHPSFITHSTCQSLYEEAKAELVNHDLNLPFGNILFVLRCYDTDTKEGHIEVMNLGQPNEHGAVFAAVWVYTVRNYWSMAYVMVIEGDQVTGPLPQRIKPDLAKEGRLQNAAMLLACVAMINRQGQAVQLDTIPPPHIIKPKGFETPNPSVRILRVDAPRLVYPKTYDNTTGRVQAGHDRRAHWATSKTGRKFWRGGQGIRVNGGALASVMTIVKSSNQ